MKTIKTEKAFNTWLMRYMRETGPSRLYPKPLVEFCDLIFAHVPEGLDKGNVEDYFGEPFSGLGAVFEDLDYHQDQVGYSALLMRYAGSLCEAAIYENVDLEHANLLAMWASGFKAASPNDPDYFAIFDDNGSNLFGSTRKFERDFDLRVRIYWKKRDDE